jgi:hypothetical protein
MISLFGSIPTAFPGDFEFLGISAQLHSTQRHGSEAPLQGVRPEDMTTWGFKQCLHGA